MYQLLILAVCNILKNRSAKIKTKTEWSIQKVNTLTLNCQDYSRARVLFKNFASNKFVKWTSQGIVSSFILSLCKWIYKTFSQFFWGWCGGGSCDTQQQLRLGVIQTRRILVCWHQLNPSLSETKVHKVCVKKKKTQTPYNSARLLVSIFFHNFFRNSSLRAKPVFIMV